MIGRVRILLGARLSGGFEMRDAGCVKRDTGFIVLMMTMLNVVIVNGQDAQCETTTVIALDKMSGELVWKSESIGAHRSNMSPIVIDHCGKKYFISATQTHVLGVDVDNGEILWTYHYNFLDKNGDNATILANTPVYREKFRKVGLYELEYR